MSSVEELANEASPLPMGVALELELHPSMEARETKDIYNPSIPFEHQGRWYILGRIESQKREDDSVVGLFDIHDGRQAGPFVIDRMQDPYYLGPFLLEDRWYNIFGGVQIDPDGRGHVSDYRELFYKYPVEMGHPLIQAEAMGGMELDVFAQGVERRKDTRFMQIEENLIGVFPRPQDEHGRFGGLGKIGYFETESLATLERDLQEYDQRADAKTLLQGLCGEEDWVGTNQIRSYSADGTYEIVGHHGRIARNEDGKKYKNYEATRFWFNKFSREVFGLEVISTADHYEPIEAKSLASAVYETADEVIAPGKIVFPAGFGRHPFEVGRLAFWSGVGDCKVAIGHVALI